MSTARLVVVNDPTRARLMAVRDGEFEAELVAEFVDPVVAHRAAQALDGDAAFLAAVSEEAPF